ncbi:hypothetical protein [Luteimonas huabeiensis]|uniref:hypothetical protein n=1 Tax=Luteimonas huabeiensis TaxID=1244513 RepID=UPI00046585D7|nr:hypothetical protein [Luteimonas huabeiensis]
MRALSPQRLSGIAAPLAVWALHFAVVYSLQGLACGEGWLRRRMAIAGVEAEAASWLLVALTALALAAIAWLGLRAQRAWRAARADPRPDADGRRRRFATAVAALAAVLAAITVAFTALPILMLPPCAR